jgi:hypothetical protein
MTDTGEQSFNSLRKRFTAYQAFYSALPFYAPQGRLGVGVNQNRAGTMYPFESPWLGTTGLVANIDLQYSAKSGFKLPFYVTRIERSRGGFNPDAAGSLSWRTMTVNDWLQVPAATLTSLSDGYKQRSYPRIVVTDADDRLVMDTDDAATKRKTVNDDLDLTTDCDSYYWTDLNGIVQLHYAEYRLADDRDYPLIFPRTMIDRVPLVSRCCHPAADPVRLKFGYSNMLPPPVTRLELVADKSVYFTVEGRRITCNVNDIPKYDGDQPRIPLRTINGLPPDKIGNFKILGDKCFHLDRKIKDIDSTGDYVKTVLVPGTLEIRNDCGQCCGCDDYIAVYELLRQLHVILSAHITFLSKARARYDVLRSKYDERVNEIMLNNSQITTTSSNGDVLINFGLNNPTNKQVDNIIVLIEFQGAGWSTPTKGDVKSFTYNSQAASLSWTWPYFYFTVPKITAFKTDYFRLLLNFPNGKNGELIRCCISSYIVPTQATVTATDSPVPNRQWGQMGQSASSLFGSSTCSETSLVK